MRKTAFYLNDILHGNPMKKHLNDLELHFGKRSGTSNERFGHLLKHSIESTEYYKSYSAYKSLDECPIIDKKTVKENYNKFISKKYEIKDLYKMTTSGSYGTPFTFYLTKEKKLKQQAEVIFFGKWSKYDIGIKHAYFMTKEKSKLKLFLQNEIIMAPYRLDEGWLKEQLGILEQKKPKVLIGYTSAIVTFANYVLEKNKKFTLDGVITVSEVLDETHRKIINNAFGVAPLSRYSTQEFGVLANECSHSHNHHINHVNYIVEILNVNDNKPVKPGEIGRVVVTDLFSYAMPLVRYDTGDLAVLGRGKCSCGLDTPYLEKISGRLIEEIRDIDNNPVSGFAVNGAMQYIEGVRQYQFIQEDHGKYTIKLILIDNYDEESISNNIRKRFKKFLGAKAEIQFEFVNEIPPLKSGKRPYILNNIKRNNKS